MKTKTFEQLLKDDQARLAKWIEMLIRQADTNEKFTSDTYPVIWFTLTGEEKIPYLIVAGWSSGFSNEENDIFFIGNGNALSIKLIPNYRFPGHDFESVSMPVDKSGVREEICMILERDEDVSGLALFFLNEIDRLTQEYHSN